jgi:hypothetical protein
VKRKVILLHANDDVATALTGLVAGETVRAELDGVAADVTVTQDIEFGHKLALRDIAEGEDVNKYGMPIGKALCAIGAGEWVHVHNVRSHRFGFHHENYGVRA